VSNELGVKSAPILKRRGRRAQKALGARDRATKTAVVLTHKSTQTKPHLPAFALLIDDVVTTGTTLAAAADTLERSGILPIAALTLAATKPPSTASARTR
jgi:predicted amidophosphoribosyltransferase